MDATANYYPVFFLVRYNGTLSDKVELKSAIDKGLGSNAFINVIDLVCAEMKVLMELDESVTCPSGTYDSVELLQ